MDHNIWYFFRILGTV